MSFLSSIASGAVQASLLSSLEPKNRTAASTYSATSGTHSSVTTAISDVGKALSAAETALVSVGSAVVDVVSAPVTAGVLLYNAAGRLLR
ncbi:hypothetical protein [Uliginosibacterium sediminicola]|uniref:Killing trait domain-containing protein n=1 Tax=Uliginosibacterium sediminicola TaxID=2024550 RepID=A0ABU9YV61_9RHOO